MKYSIFTLVLIILFNPVKIFAQDSNITDNNIGKFIITITGFSNNNGKAMIALYNNEEDYTETLEVYKTAIKEIQDKTVEWIIDDLLFGEYAIKVYHDENENLKLDKNFLGIPKEEYGFSNNATGSFGPASYEDAKLIFSKPHQQHLITID